MATWKVAQVVSYFVLVYIQVVSSESYIVDTKSPVVITRENGRNRNDYSDNFFGYSLTHMKGFGDEDKSRPQSVTSKERSSSVTLFIGAPKEKGFIKSGVVWSCKFENNAYLSCSVQKDFSQHNSPQQECPSHSPPLEKFPENQSDQWIGASLSATSKSLVVCAPRWKKNKFLNNYNQCNNDETAMVGACYELNPKVNKIITVRAPMDHPDLYNYIGKDDWGKSTSEYLYLYAEYGLSSHFTRTNNLLVGAPSARKWTGMYIEHLQQVDIHHNMDGKFGIESHSLLGYSITSGRYQGLQYYTAVGAPRGERLYGLVVIKPAGQTTIKGETVTGRSFGAYFGYSVATANLNGDLNDELLVGAPMHTDFKSASSYNTGCVYVYDILVLGTQQDRVQLRHSICPDSGKSPGQVSSGARFGSAIVNLGDINYDGKEDFAVSAPYNNDGYGSVFIYFGGDSNTSPLPAQIIHGQSFDIPNLRGFGNSMHSNQLDIDENGTPDLAIGAYESGHVVVLRTRPIANATVVVAFYDSKKNEKIVKFLPTQQNFRVQICVTFHFSVELPQDNEFNAWLRCEVDSGHSHKRFAFTGEEGSEVQHIFSNKKKTCVFRSVQLDGSLDDSNEKPPIRFNATFWYNETQQLESTKVELAAVTLSPQRKSQQTISPDQSYQRAFRKFNPYLPAPIPETVGWDQLAIANDNCATNKNPECETKLGLAVKIAQADIHGNHIIEDSLIIGKTEEVGLSITINNDGETAYNPTAKVIFILNGDFNITMKSLKIAWSDTSVMQNKGRKTIQCKEVDMGLYNNKSAFTVLRCSRALQTLEKMELTLKLSMLNQMKIKDTLEGALIVKVEAYADEMEELLKEKVVISKEISLEGKVKLHAKHWIPQESDIDPRNSVLTLTQYYTVTNSEVSATSEDAVRVEILIPTFFNIANKPTEILGIAYPSSSNLEHSYWKCEANGFTFYDPTATNLSKNEASSTFSADRGNFSSRSTRSTKEIQMQKNPDHNQVQPEKSIVAPSISGNKIKLSGCEETSCRKITCATGLLSNSSRDIKIHMYLIPNVLEKFELEEINGIEVDSSMSVFVPFIPEAIKSTGSTSRSFTLIKGVPAYIYLISVSGGIILLLLMIFCLFRCGFFKREKKEELKQIKRQTQMLTEADLRYLATLEPPEDNPDPAEPQQGTSRF